MPYDLLIAGGTLIDPAQNTHAPADIAFKDNRVAAVGASLDREGAREVVDATGHYVIPGMIDVHVHVFEGVSHYGIPPDPTCLAKGATTAWMRAPQARTRSPVSAST